MKKQHQTSELIAYVERRAVSWSEDSDGIEVYLDTGMSAIQVASTPS